MHAMLILVKVTLQTSRKPDIKAYFRITTAFVGWMASMWWPYPADMALQLSPKLMQARSYCRLA
jgi:hypothetical protein